MNVQSNLSIYLKSRPLFLSLIRVKEAAIFQHYLPLAGPVLDVGVGDGFFAKIAFKQIDVGIDLPGSRMPEAQKLNIYQKLVEFDGVKIPFKNNYFQTVVSNCVLEHVEKLPELLSEIGRVLKPGGIFLTTVMAKPWEDYLMGTKVFGNGYKNYMRVKQVHLNLLTVNNWDKVFVKAGFKIEKRIGYLPEKACKLIDLAHYLSVPSLISYILFRKWVLFPRLLWYPEKYLSGLVKPDVSPDKSGAIFYVLKKS
jgi:ubiquinone/menaquinone biosynthesis C-methylase UbiE